LRDTAAVTRASGSTTHHTQMLVAETTPPPEPCRGIGERASRVATGLPNQTPHLCRRQRWRTVPSVGATSRSAVAWSAATCEPGMPRHHTLLGLWAAKAAGDRNSRVRDTRCRATDCSARQCLPG
jgi:hypothetical protein